MTEPSFAQSLSGEDVVIIADYIAEWLTDWAYGYPPEEDVTCEQKDECLYQAYELLQRLQSRGFDWRRV